MRVAIFDTHTFEKSIIEDLNTKFHHELHFFEERLTEKTAILAEGYSCVCAFANDRLNRDVIEKLSRGNTKLIALRSAGFSHVDLEAAREHSIKVVRVPEYSPYSVAEFAVTLILGLNRKIHKAYNRVREGNFSLDGLVGFDLHGKSVGVIGGGKIGKAFARIMRGFGCQVLLFDISPDEHFAKETGCLYASFEEVIKNSDIISLHVPLRKETFHLVDERVLKEMKKGSILINTGRGALVDTKALIDSLKSNHLAAAGLDVYEEEEGYFFKDLSGHVLEDDVLARLMTFPNVLLTSHQGFLTNEAIHNIAHTTLSNISDFERGAPLLNEVK